MVLPELVPLEPPREGVTWHDGRPFTAKDVQCTFDMLTGKSSEKLRVNPRKAWYANLDNLTTNGDYEVTFHLKRPQPAFLAVLVSGFSPVYPCHVPPRDMRSHPIGTGPFKFVEFKPNEYIKVTRNHNLKGWLATSIARAMLLDKPRRQILLNGLRDMPDGDRLCHGDFHPMNVLGKASQPIVIDWPNACRGDPAGDVCRSYLILKLHADEVSGSYLDAYCQVTCVPRRTILDWLPYAAAARLMEDVPSEQPRLLERVRSL
jgi:Bacterial extracellular solute-binding proteins, family 5 Middle/Phosphotransferase enzyme family